MSTGLHAQSATGYIGNGWVTYGDPDRPELGYVSAGAVEPVARPAGESINDALSRRARPASNSTAAQRRSVREVTVLPSSPQPGKIIGVGANYYQPGDAVKPATYPVLFTKYAASLVGPYDDIVLPPETTHADYEGELAVVIGARGRRIPADRAHEHILGYSVANDVTLRDWQSRSHQWLQGKAWDRTTPLGPVIAPAERVDLATARIHTAVNGITVQHGYIRDMIRPVPELIATISTFTTLEPGDVILTGTPAHLIPGGPTPLTAGDLVTITIDAIGQISNRFTATN
jgi:acylpyruvate hydrolase